MIRLGSFVCLGFWIPESSGDFRTAGHSDGERVVIAVDSDSSRLSSSRIGGGCALAGSMPTCRDVMVLAVGSRSMGSVSGSDHPDRKLTPILSGSVFSRLPTFSLQTFLRDCRTGPSRLGFRCASPLTTGRRVLAIAGEYRPNAYRLFRLSSNSRVELCTFRLSGLQSEQVGAGSGPLESRSVESAGLIHARLGLARHTVNPWESLVERRTTPSISVTYSAFRRSGAR
jgi:hypothetical protein